MKRLLVVALAAVVVIPCSAAAQTSDAGWGPKLRITPFVGISPNFKQTGEANVFSSAGFSQHDYELRFASGFGLGVGAEYNVWNRFSVLGSAMWSSRGDAELLDFDDELIYEVDGTNLWLFKGAVGVRMREIDPDMQLRRLNAIIYAGPAFVHDRPKKELFTPPAAAQVENHIALNIGAEAEMPISNNKMAFTLGLDDYMIFWNDEDARGRIEGTLQARTADAEVAVEPKRSHLWMLRFGLTWRLF
jgi:hypothetical protein